MSRNEAENILCVLRAWPPCQDDVKQVEIFEEAERACVAVIRRADFQVIEGGRIAA